MDTPAEILTLAEVAEELRCSKSHIAKVVNGQVANVTALPAIAVGRRKLVRRCSLEAWKQANEKQLVRGILPSSLEVNAADA